MVALDLDRAGFDGAAGAAAGLEILHDRSENGFIFFDPGDERDGLSGSPGGTARHTHALSGFRGRLGLRARAPVGRPSAPRTALDPARAAGTGGVDGSTCGIGHPANRTGAPSPGRLRRPPSPSRERASEARERGARVAAKLSARQISPTLRKYSANAIIPPRACCQS